MVAPYWVDNTQSSNNSTSTTLTISIPTTIQAGDLLLLNMAISTPATMAFPSNNGGWPSMRTPGTSFSNWMAYHFCDGTESGSISVTAGSAVSFAATISRVRGVDNSFPPENTVSTSGTGLQSFTPAAATASWSSPIDNLFCVLVNQRGGVQRTGVTTYPYATGQSFQGTSADNNTACCFKQSNSQSDTPGVFTWASSGGASAGISGTIVMRGMSSGFIGLLLP